MTIARMNGMPVQTSSRARDPWIAAPTSLACFRRYRIAKMMTSVVTSTAKNALTEIRKKYRLSTRGASVDACVGKRGVPGCIVVSRVLFHPRQRAGPLAAPEQHDARHERHDGGDSGAP